MESKQLLTLEEQKVIALNILKDIHEFCIENEIKYFLAYGSLLGAVRHNGFIPWDDDIDIVMFRDDYQRFLENYNKNHQSSQYKCISFEDGSFYLPYSKVIDTTTKVQVENFVPLEQMGVFVDIFPYDYLGDDKEEAQKKLIKLRKYKKMLRYSLYNQWNELGFSFWKVPYLVFYLMSKFLGTKRISRILKKKMKKMQGKIPTKYCGCLIGEMGEDKGCYETELFGNGTKILYEDTYVISPIDAHMYLKKTYGDYMKLPPEHERVAHLQKAYRR